MLPSPQIYNSKFIYHLRFHQCHTILLYLSFMSLSKVFRVNEKAKTNICNKLRLRNTLQNSRHTNNWDAVEKLILSTNIYTTKLFPLNIMFDCKSSNLIFCFEFVPFAALLLKGELEMWYLWSNIREGFLCFKCYTVYIQPWLFINVWW